MDGLYVYGVVGWTGAESVSCRARGLGGAPTLFIVHQDLAAVVSPSPVSSWPTDAEHLACHEAVVEDVMRSHPILPVRFNTFLRSEEATIRLLCDRAEEFRADLGRVRGKSELGLRILWEPPPTPLMPDPPPGPPAGPGTAYLWQRLQDTRRRAVRHRAGEALIQSLHAAFQPLAAASHLQPFPGDRSLFAAAYLVDHERIAEFRESVAATLTYFPQLDFLLTGPWPPYHFVKGVEDGVPNPFRH